MLFIAVPPIALGGIRPFIVFYRIVIVYRIIEITNFFRFVFFFSSNEISKVSVRYPTLILTLHPRTPTFCICIYMYVKLVETRKHIFFLESKTYYMYMYNNHIFFRHAALRRPRVLSRTFSCGGKQGGRGYITTHVWISAEHRGGARGIPRG